MGLENQEKKTILKCCNQEETEESFVVIFCL